MVRSCAAICRHQPSGKYCAIPTVAERGYQNHMSRLYLRLILTAFALFSVALLLIRTQPYDDHELRNLLLPTDCVAPCLIGIKPGVTTVDAAMDILETNPWIGDIRTRAGTIEWTWSSL